MKNENEKLPVLAGEEKKRAQEGPAVNSKLEPFEEPVSDEDVKQLLRSMA